MRIIKTTLLASLLFLFASSQAFAANNTSTIKAIAESAEQITPLMNGQYVPTNIEVTTLSGKKVPLTKVLNNKKTTPEALEFLISDKSKELFISQNVLSEREIEARYEIEVEKYKLSIQIESRVMADMGLNHIIPTAVEYQKGLVENVNGLKTIFGDEFIKYASEQIDMIKDISQHIQDIRKNITDMTTARKAANKMEREKDQAKAYCNNVKPFFEKIRYDVDKLELLVDNKNWPLPKYREMLFTK